MSSDKSLDLVGIGKLAEAIPPEAWKVAVTTSSEIIRSFLAPITSTTSGIGRVIEAKFDGMVDLQRVLVADVIEKAKIKINASGLALSDTLDPNVIIPCIESASIQTDEDMRELWSNLLAQELTQADVHPEIPRLLMRITSNDAITLSDIAQGEDKAASRALARRLSQPTMGSAPLKSDFRFRAPKAPPLSNVILQSLSLIYEDESSGWRLTRLGKEFIRAVSGPLAPVKNPAKGSREK